MPDLFYLLSKWWKQMLLVIVLSLAVVTLALYLRPAKYLSVVTALPASSYTADKASVFNNSIQSLYPDFGSPEDLDMIIGTAQLDTVYIAVADAFNLTDHYKTEEKGEAAILKAASLLKADTKVIKSDFSELKIKVWDKDNILASQLANAIADKLQTIHQDLQNSHNTSVIKTLQAGKEKLQQNIDSINNYLKKGLIDSKSPDEYVARRVTLTNQLQQYEQLINEYQVLIDNKPPALIIVEKARPASWPDKPKKLPLLTATFVLSFLFALALALFLEKRKAV